MPRILIAECKQEVSTFNPHLSGYSDFRIRTDDEFLRHHRAVRYEVGGALEVFEQVPDIELVPTYSAMFITSGGPLAVPDWRRIADEFLEGLRGAPAVDGVYFSMHGAMASEDEFDPEGYLLAESRKILGEDVPIVVSFDLHGIVSERLLKHADALVVYHSYPHVDFFETGQRAARLLLKIISGEVAPVTACVPVPALVRGNELVTETGLFGGVIDDAKAIEATDEGLAAGMLIGNPFTDVPNLQTYSLVTADNDPDWAEQKAVAMARKFWSHREAMQTKMVSLDEMAAIALEQSGGTLGLVDAADATSSGASGDSVAILSALLKAGYRGRVLAPVVDAPTAERAFQTGVGGRVTARVGGTLDPRFDSLEISARVRLLSDGTFRSESFGDEWVAGKTAVLETDHGCLVVSSRAVNLYDRSFFYAHGQRPETFDAVVIKSPYCEYHMYEGWCERMVQVDAPGSTSANLLSLGHQRCPRPIFPLDPKVPFEPQARLFQRSRTRVSNR